MLAIIYIDTVFSVVKSSRLSIFFLTLSVFYPTSRMPTQFIIVATGDIHMSAYP